MNPPSPPDDSGSSLRAPAPTATDDPRWCLSALADGERQAVDSACAMWREDEQARQTWHLYHLIGDVLRSDELASAPAHDAAFLEGLRARLASEPVVLAPAPATVPAGGLRRWRVPVAAAAGFVVVAGVLVVLRLNAPRESGGWSTLASASRPGATLVGSGAPSAVGNPMLIRDPRLDELLRAHQSARAGIAVAAPGGELRRAEAVAPAGAER